MAICCTRRSPSISFLALALVIACLLVSLHAPTSSYVQQQLPKPIHDYLSPPQQPSCPSVHDRGRPPLSHKTQTCHSVPSKIPAFNLEVCYTQGTCNQFTTRITRTSAKECREAERTPDPFVDPALSTWMRKERGPDAFYLRTDGAERYASVYDTYEGQCTYSFDVRLKNPGKSYLQIWWTYEVCLPYLFPVRMRANEGIEIHGVLRNQLIMASNAP
jgi:energy-converting hydrogenase Eha subunit F